MKTLFASIILCLFSTVTLADEANSSGPLFAATLNNLDDAPVSLDRYRGKPLVVNFWARWCAPCRSEIPDLIKFRSAHKGKVEVLGIGIEDKAVPAKEFAKAYAMDYPVFVAKEKGIPLMQRLGNTKGGLPYTLFIDRNGEIIQKRMGIVRQSDLADVAPALLKP